MDVKEKQDYEDELLKDIQEYEYQEMFEKANTIVLGFVVSTTATGAVPIPFADAPLLIGQQVAMMIAINSVFEFDIERDALTSLATAAIGVGGATVIGKTVASNLIKLIPGVGTVAGGAISAGTAGVITLALGKAYIEVCKAIEMGKLDQGDLTKKAGLDMLKISFKEQMKKNGGSQQEVTPLLSVEAMGKPDGPFPRDLLYAGFPTKKNDNEKIDLGKYFHNVL